MRQELLNEKECAAVDAVKSKMPGPSSGPAVKTATNLHKCRRTKFNMIALYAGCIHVADDRKKMNLKLAHPRVNL
uniref:Uncharacterized protein n=1 Tax=Romanomermis culicivorax TaxID=13658 RepID=A0A915K5M4_ROMCU